MEISSCLRQPLLYFIFFFFQAEDGIRDLTVTGVQTCALPISFCKHDERLPRSHGMLAERVGQRGLPRGSERLGQPALTRSEERRVGKECRSRWSPYH